MEHKGSKWVGKTSQFKKRRKKRRKDKAIIFDNSVIAEEERDYVIKDIKIPSSRRILSIPDYVFEAILEERKKYEKWRSRRKSVFHDDGYICCSNFSGKPRSKDFHWRHYKELLKRTGLPNIRWHDLRSTYCTLLLNNDFSPEAVSRLMGHVGELITIDVYGDNTNIIPEEIPKLISYMDEVMPKKTLQGNDSETDGKGVLDTMIDMEEFFPEKAVKSDV